MDRVRNSSAPSSKSTVVVGTSTDSGSSRVDPQYPYVVNGTAIFINRGAAADIWLVQTPESKYIIKILRLNLEYLSTSQARNTSREGTNQPDDPAQRFMQTIRFRAGSWTSLQHENVIKVFGLGERLDLRVEFCENGTARKYLERYNDGTDRKKLIIQHILEGMDYLHSQNPPIVHGCLRADKIFISADGTAKIGEFGLSFLTRDFALHAHSISQAGLSRWMSPELVNIDPDTGTVVPTTASDIWALACTLLEIMSSEVPYNKYQHELKVRRAIIRGEQPGAIDVINNELFLTGISLILPLCWNMSPNYRPSVSKIQRSVRSWAVVPGQRKPTYGSPSSSESLSGVPDLENTWEHQPRGYKAARKLPRGRASGSGSVPSRPVPVVAQSSDPAYRPNAREKRVDMREKLMFSACDNCKRSQVKCVFDPPNAAVCQGCRITGKDCVVNGGEPGRNLGPSELPETLIEDSEEGF